MEVFDETTLEKIYTTYVAAELHPRGKSGPLTNISFSRHAMLQRMVASERRFHGEAQTPGRILGITVRWDKLAERARSSIAPEMRGLSGIFISDQVDSVEQLKFVLLHELGHLHWDLHRAELADKWKAGEEEFYADFFAFDAIQKVDGLDTALNTLKRYCSAPQWWDK